MEKQVTLTANGQEVTQADFNTVSEESSKGTDWLLSELLRPSLSGAVGYPSKFIVPAGSRNELQYNGGAGDLNRRPVIGVSGLADAKVRIAPFLAVITSMEVVASDVKKATRGIRTAGHYGSDATHLPWTDIQLAATTNRRWDLIYARVDIDTPDAAVSRFVKSGSGAAAAASLVVTKQTNLTLGYVQGVEAASNPSLPVLPADSASTFYIALGYVQRGGTESLTTLLLSNTIWEMYSTISMSPALGVANVRPADGTYRVSGNSHVNEIWNSTNGRPKTHMPPSMVGKEERFIPIHAFDSGHGNPSCPINTTTVVDGSIDWGRRLFKTWAGKSTSNDGFPWSAISPPAAGANAWNDHNATPEQTMRRGQSWINDASALTGGALASGCVVAWFSQLTTPALAAGALIVLFVNSSGQLCVWRNNVNAACYLLIWLEASAPFLNMDADGL